MSSAPLSPTASDSSAVPTRIPLSKPDALTWHRYVVLAMVLMIAGGLGMRAKGLGSIGFAEDEINKLEAVRAYDHGDFSANAEHPMLMKVLMDLSLRGARRLSSLGVGISEEAAVRFPNVVVGALTAIPLFLLTAALFDRRTGLWAAALWSFGLNAITYNRIGKEDTLMVFFMLFAFYFFIRAKQVDTRERRAVRKYLNLSAVSFGLMMASKYFPHYFGLNMLYHHKYHIRERAPEEPPFSTPFTFFVLIGVVFLIANPGLVLPGVWEHLNAYSAEKLVPHTGYIMGNTIYSNRMSNSPGGLPVWFYVVFMAIKIPLSVLAVFLVGLALSVKQWRAPGPRFVLFMFIFWIVPYSLVGAKWLRYTLSLMPFVYMGAAFGAVVLVGWLSKMFAGVKRGPVVASAATALMAIVLIVVPVYSVYGAAPHYALYSNLLGDRYTAWFFPHDEFYDDGVNEAIQFICERAPQNAAIVSETPGVVRYYTAKFGRTDLQSHVLSDPKYTPSTAGPTYVILQKGRTYFENQQEMKEVKAQFTLVYAGCIRGHTAAEVYGAPANAAEAVQPCGDVRP